MHKIQREPGNIDTQTVPSILGLGVLQMVHGKIRNLIPDMVGIAPWKVLMD